MSFIFNADSDTASLFAHLSFLSSFCFLFKGNSSSVIFYLAWCAPCKIVKNLINQILKYIAQGRKK